MGTASKRSRPLAAGLLPQSEDACHSACSGQTTAGFKREGRSVCKGWMLKPVLKVSGKDDAHGPAFSAQRRMRLHRLATVEAGSIPLYLSLD